MDAVRLSDGEMICLKRITRSEHPDEVELAMMFSTEPLKSHPKNHCVPIFEVLEVPRFEDDCILVMPLLKPFHEPRFMTVGESVAFFEQLFEVRLLIYIASSSEYLFICLRGCNSFISAA